MKLYFKHYPLPQHTNARLAAEGAVAAQKQGKFWQFQDKLWEHQDELSPAEIEKVAKETGLDLAKFRQDLASAPVKAKVDKDRNEGASIGLQATPTLYIDGREYTDTRDADSLREWIKDALELELSAARGRPFVLLSLGCATPGAVGGGSGGPVGAPLPPLTVDALSGKTINVASYKGRVLLLDVWASWCDPCKQELPVLNDMARRLKSQGIDILAVSVDQERENVDKFLRAHGAAAGRSRSPTIRAVRSPSCSSPTRCPPRTWSTARGSSAT